MNNNQSLPYHRAAERYVLGNLILDGGLIVKCLGKLRPEDFYNSQHSAVFSALEKLAERGSPVSHVSIVETLTDGGLDPTFETVKDIVVLVEELTRGLPKTDEIDYFVGLLKRKTYERNKLAATAKLQDALLQNDKAKAAEAEQELFDLASMREEVGPQRTSEFSDSVLNNVYKKGVAASPITGLPTGVLDFDLLTAGLQGDDLMILAARPGAGKTAIALNIAQFCAVRRDKIALVFSIEMSKAQLYMRMLSSQARIAMQKIRTGFLNRNEWARLCYAQEKLDNAKIIIDDNVSLTPLHIRAAIKTNIIMHGRVDLVIVDYLQLMSSGRKAENRQQEVTQISKELKIIAKEFHIPIIALSQLSRATESRSSNGHRPQISDLRESGSLEQDADLVAFIYRGEMYGKTPENDGLAELIVAKNRHGDTATINLAYIKEYTRFENLFITGA